MRDFEHLMIDIETMGTDSFSSIISISAIEFDIDTAETGKTFHVNVDLQSCVDIGLGINPSTVMWWLNQSNEARFELLERENISIEEALKRLTVFCYKYYKVWGNSPRFDCGILQNAYSKIGLNIPWRFQDERCVRTLASLDTEMKNSIKNKGVAHNSLDDCYYQIEYCCAIWKSLKTK